jgi:Domain of unknown function (DUF4367)
VATKTIIEINGRKYDARTGEIISDTAPTQGSTVKSTPKAHQNHKQNSGVIDSIQRPKRTAHPVAKITPKTQKSKTLVRSIVKKPSETPVKANAVEQNSQTEFSQPTTQIIDRTPQERIDRAHATSLNRNVSRFATTQTTAQPKITTNLPVKKENLGSKHKHTPDAPPPIHSVSKNNSHPTKQQVFTHPLAGATNHLAVPVKKQKLRHKVADRLQVSSKALSIGAAVFAVLFLGSFLAYQRVPNIGLRIAAVRTGFSGTLPTNTPAGYAFKGPVEYSKESVALTYKSNSDDRTFQIIQRPSDWSSDALLTNYVKNTKAKYQTYQDRGLTIFIMDGNNTTWNASWVNKGIWYTLSSNGTLSTEQILSMASSM